jgi:hypothetical protein
VWPLRRPWLRGSLLPPIRPQGGVELTWREHIDALDACDVDRMMALYPREILFIQAQKTWGGREKVFDFFNDYCQPFSEGGFKGGKFIIEDSKTFADTVTVRWRMEADFLSQPYYGAVTYVTHDGLIYVQTTTFNPNTMPYKEPRTVTPGEGQ